MNVNDILNMGHVVVDNNLMALVNEIAVAPKSQIREDLIKIYFAASRWYIDSGDEDPIDTESRLSTLERLIDALK